MVGNAYRTAQTFWDCLLVLVRYFLIVPAFGILAAFNSGSTACLEIVIKAKKSCMACEKPAPRKLGRGCPPKKESAVYLKELFVSHKE